MFFTSCLTVFKLMFLFIELANLFQNEGSIWKTFLPHISFTKRNFKFSIIIYWTYSTLWSSIFKSCSYIIRGLLTYLKTVTVKGTLMQIWKSACIFVFTWKYVENFTLKHFVRFEICEHEICGNFLFTNIQKQ